MVGEIVRLPSLLLMELTRGPASAELGIALAATERVGVVLGLATLGVSQDGQVPVAKLVTVPPLLVNVKVLPDCETPLPANVTVPLTVEDGPAIPLTTVGAPVSCE